MGRLQFVIRFELRELRKQFSVKNGSILQESAAADPPKSALKEADIIINTVARDADGSSAASSSPSLSGVDALSGRYPSNTSMTQTGRSMMEAITRNVSQSRGGSSSTKPVRDRAKEVLKTINVELTERARFRLLQENWTSFTIKRNLASLCAFHTNLCQILEAIDINPPPFPDLYLFGEMEESAVQHFSQGSSNKRPLSGIGSASLGVINRVFSVGINQAEEAKNSGSSNNPQVAPSFQDACEGLQVYLRSVLALYEYIDELISQSDYKGEFEIPTRSMGTLLADLLQSSDFNDILASNQSENDFGEAETRPQDELSARETLSSSQSHLNSDNHSRTFWSSYLPSSGLNARINFAEENSGYFRSKDEQDLMKIQRARCLGCGEQLMSGLFGFDRNYFMCNFYGGLFCRKWCHQGESRVVPLNVIRYWDCKPHKV